MKLKLLSAVVDGKGLLIDSHFSIFYRIQMDRYERCLLHVCVAVNVLNICTYTGEWLNRSTWQTETRTERFSSAASYFAVRADDRSGPKSARSTSGIFYELFRKGGWMERKDIRLFKSIRTGSLSTSVTTGSIGFRWITIARIRCRANGKRP